MAYQKNTVKINRRRVGDELVEQAYSVLKDAQVEMHGHVLASLFRGDPNDPLSLIEQAETENVIMQWYIDIAPTLPLMLFHMLAGGINDFFNGGLYHYISAGTNSGTYELPNAPLLYVPPNWKDRYSVFRGSNAVVPFSYLLCSTQTGTESANESLLPTGVTILSSVRICNPSSTVWNLRTDAGYTAVIDKRTIKWVYDFAPTSFSGTISSVHLAEGTTQGVSRQFARALLGSPISKTTDDTFRVQWTFTRDLLPGEPA